MLEAFSETSQRSFSFCLLYGYSPGLNSPEESQSIHLPFLGRGLVAYFFSVTRVLIILTHFLPRRLTNLFYTFMFSSGNICGHHILLVLVYFIFFIITLRVPTKLLVNLRLTFTTSYPLWKLFVYLQ